MNSDSELDLKGAWDTFWTTISGTYSGSPIETIVTCVGIGLIAFSVLKYFWDKRRGNAGIRGHSAIWWSLGFGALLTGPAATIPFVLGLLQVVIDIAMNLISSATSTGA
ncbi:hypothetical protein [Leifsonia sp. Leaf264]|uniref:hypothetical protein n=1 Tax=Leifsonia sp. Leaf264 TaxID=1736314 RepID=UPI0006F2EC95|nr:hypothetical protein [Leifsonia sp. Leaf264]KQP01415.1 hypothetical protein ASF30_02015 [Leifsonia sp. Leaf264]